MIRRNVNLMLVAFLVAIISACATFNLKQSAKKAQIIADDFYVTQYDDYTSNYCVKDENGDWQLKPDLSDEMQDVLAKRHDMLSRLSELSDKLEKYIAIGELSDDQTLPAIEYEITDIIRRFE